MKIFIVYCHKDVKNLNIVKGIIEELGHEPIILDREKGCGTIFDKFHKYALQCQKAIVLYSRGDVGCQYKKNIKNDDLKSRTKENVLFEFGFFVGYLKIENVLILLNNNIDRTTLPSDLAGLETSRLIVSRKTLKNNIIKFLS